MKPKQSKLDKSHFRVKHSDGTLYNKSMMQNDFKVYKVKSGKKSHDVIIQQKKIQKKILKNYLFQEIGNSFHEKCPH